MTIDNLPEKEFEEVLLLIREARGRVFRNINQELIGLYWRIGEYISSKVEKEQWGKGYATEAISLVVNYAFNNLNLHRVTAGCTELNLGSLKAFQKNLKAPKKK